MATQQALFAAGCFWGVQYYFDQIPGVIETLVGYTGGTVPNPNYDQVCTGTTGHAEAIRVTFDPSKVAYEVLVKQFFHMHDPTQVNRQGPDVGNQYRSAIFYISEQQKLTAEKIKKETQKQYKQPIATEITKAGPFYEAEEYHQKFTERTGIGMCHIPYEPMH